MSNINASVEEIKPTDSVPKFHQLAGLSAVLSGIFYIIVGLFHQENVITSVTTPAWTVVHIFALAMTVLGLIGMAGLYTKQKREVGKTGLTGYIFLSLWMLIVACFTFVEIFILPKLATISPEFVEGFLGIFTGAASNVSLAALSAIWAITGLLYLVGGLLFGIATFRANVLPRRAAILLAAGTFLAPVAALLPGAQQPKIAIPVGLALVWLGYALWSGRKNK